MVESSTRSVDRALNLLAAICDDGRMTLSEAARSVALSPSTALRLLRTLETSGFVRRDDNGVFRPGTRIVQLGAQSLSNESLVALAHPVMVSLVDESGESVYLSIEGHRSTALYIHIVEGTHSVRHTSWVGRTIPLDRSAAGAVLMGHTPDEGYVVIERGVEADVTAIAAPIRSERSVVAALSLVIPTYRIDELGVARHGRALADAAAELSAALSKQPASAREGEA